MTHQAPLLRLPEEIKARTIAFLNWYFDACQERDNDTDGPMLHSESAQIEYDWRPRSGEVSRLTLVDRATGMIAVGGFDFNRLSEADAQRQAPPFSLLMTTWFDLCLACEWITEGRRAELDERLRPRTEQDQHELGTALYG